MKVLLVNDNNLAGYANPVPRLRPKIRPWVQALVNDPGLLSDALAGWGSPLHVHRVNELQANANGFRDTFTLHGVQGTICYARKANRCRAVVKHAIQIGLHLDVASLDEARECIELGCDSSRMICTAATKSDELLAYCRDHRILVVLDNDEEADILVRVLPKDQARHPVALRFGSFPGLGRNALSRFGFPYEKRVEAIEKFRSEPKLLIHGFQFHLDGYSIEERGRALWQLIDLSRIARGKGVPIEFLDIGGGMTVDYLESSAEWDEFLIELKNSVAGDRPAVTFGNDGLGYVKTTSGIEGLPKLYPFSNSAPKDAFLKGVLESQNSEGEKLADVLRTEGLKLYIEPGRALLDQVGVTVAVVSHAKKGPDGETYVSLEMNGSNIRSVSLDYCLDPLFVTHQSDSKEQSQPVSGFLFGNSCMESDLILKRRLWFPRVPCRGDYFVFPNTAGYHMHLFENSGHSFSLPRNVIFTLDEKLTRDERPRQVRNN